MVHLVARCRFIHGEHGRIQDRFQGVRTEGASRHGARRKQRAEKCELKRAYRLMHTGLLKSHVLEQGGARDSNTNVDTK